MAGVTEEPRSERLQTARLELYPLLPAAAAALPGDRERATELTGATLHPDWPHPDLLDVLPRQAAAAPGGERFGIWLIVERDSQTVIGDIGFFGPPSPEGTVEIGYSIAADRRRRGYATEAAAALIAWARRRSDIVTVLARCEEDNLPSIRTLERLGFARAGKVDEMLAWRL